MTGRRKTILVVEDDDRLRRQIKLALGFAGFDTREARTGMEALAMLDGGRPDLVVLDLVLPGSMGSASARNSPVIRQRERCPS